MQQPLNTETLNSSQIKAFELRSLAKLLLQQAKKIDALNPYIVIHEHEFGTTGYLTWFDHEPSEHEAVAVLDSTFEPDRGEVLTVESSITLDDLAALKLSKPNVVATPTVEEQKWYHGTLIEQNGEHQYNHALLMQTNNPADFLKSIAASYYDAKGVEDEGSYWHHYRTILITPKPNSTLLDPVAAAVMSSYLPVHKEVSRELTKNDKVES